jgi:hypothetical protein
MPEGPEDVEGADQKTKYCNYIFYRENNGFNVLYESIKDGLIMKNGIIKVYPEVSKSVKFSSFQGLTEMQAAMSVRRRAWCKSYTCPIKEGSSECVICASLCIYPVCIFSNIVAQVDS